MPYELLQNSGNCFISESQRPIPALNPTPEGGFSSSLVAGVAYLSVMQLAAPR